MKEKPGEFIFIGWFNLGADVATATAITRAVDDDDGDEDRTCACIFRIPFRQVHMEMCHTLTSIGFKERLSSQSATTNDEHIVVVKYLATKAPRRGLRFCIDLLFENGTARQQRTPVKLVM